MGIYCSIDCIYRYFSSFWIDSIVKNNKINLQIIVYLLLIFSYTKWIDDFIVEVEEDETEEENLKGYWSSKAGNTLSLFPFADWI